MSAEYSGRMDDDKTVPIWPRPLTSVAHRIRAQNLTGDPSGLLDTDNKFWWQGLDRFKMATLDAQRSAEIALDAAIDALWY